MAESCAIHFDHLQFFVDELKPLAFYKAIEENLNALAQTCTERGVSVKQAPRDTTATREIWKSIVGSGALDPSTFSSQGQDLVEQLLYGFGWRVTGTCSFDGTRSLVVASDDPSGVKFIVTAPEGGVNEAAVPPPPEKKARSSATAGEGGLKEKSSEAVYRHFDLSDHARFTRSHAGAQGVGVLGFLLPNKGDLQRVLGNFRAKHPALLVHGNSKVYGGGGEVGSVEVLDVFAYYRPAKAAASGGSNAEADPGTVIRFVERNGDATAAAPGLPLPGLSGVSHAFCGTGTACYCDHWVSNVFDREGFLAMLNDTLGFTPKVDFNAGVVAAGEAQIESTVTGNTSALVTADASVALADQSQVYLPTNNALSPVGHVHWYLEELGQGIQHVAARVQSLPDFVQRANDYREVTGQGFTFLNIPRTYYGLLDEKLLVRGLEDKGSSGSGGSAEGKGVSPECAAAVMGALAEAKLVDGVGAVALESVAPTSGTALLDQALGSGKVPGYDDEASGVRDKVLAIVRRSVYLNLHKLLGSQIDEATYLNIVRNKILVDVQGEDVLMQIFTSCVLQREAGKEAPFLEFIQRLCHVSPHAEGGASGGKPQPIRPGCGGFGIRNFLTLFLSIEVSKAMADKNACAQSGDGAGVAYHAKRVKLFTQQLVDSNPILTEISDCMTGEGRCLDAGDTGGAAVFTARKETANAALQACSAKFNELMKTLREAQAPAAGK